MTNIGKDNLQNITLEGLKNLGNHRLDHEEISYLRNKDALWYKDINDGLVNDIEDANQKQLSNDTKSKTILNYLASKPDLLIDKCNWIGKGIFGPFLKATLTKCKTFQSQCVIINTLLSFSSTDLTPDERRDIVRPDLICSFSYTTVKALHRYQKKYENTAGRSKADCIMGSKTLQQLVSDCNIPMQDIAGTNIILDKTFSTSKIHLKNTYNWANESQIAIDAVMKDPALNSVEKTKEMLKICKSTNKNQLQEKDINTKDKRYGAVVSMILSVKTLLSVADDVTKVAILQCFDKKFQKEIATYWNSKNSREDLGISKTDNFWKELNEVKLASDEWKNKITLALSTASARKSYIDTCATNAAKEFGPQIDSAINSLRKLSSYDGVDHSRQIASLLEKVFITSEAYRMKHNRVFNNPEHDAVQKALLSIITSIFLQKTGSTFSLNVNKICADALSKTIDIPQMKPQRDAIKKKIAEIASGNITIDWSKGSIDIINLITSIIRVIDAKFDGGIFDHYQTGDGLTEMLESSHIAKPRDIRFTNGKNYQEYNRDMDAMKILFDQIPNTKLNELIHALDKTISSTHTVYIEHGMKTTETSTSFDKGALDSVLTKIGLDGISDDCKKDMRNKYSAMKKEVIKQGTDEAHDSINKIVSSFQSAVDFQKRQGNSKNAEIMQTQADSWISFRDKKGPMPIPNNPKLAELLQSFGLQSGTVTMEDFVQKIVDEKLQISSSTVLEHYMTVGVMEKHASLIDALESTKVKNSTGKILSLYANIHGVGSGWSDVTYNTVMDVSKEVTIMLVTTIATMGIGAAFSAAGRAIQVGGEMALAVEEGAGLTMLTDGAITQVLSKSPSLATKFGTWASKWTSMAKICAKTARGVNAVRGTNIIGKGAVGLTKMAVEGSAFHFSSTAMSNVLHGQDWNIGLNEWEGYAKTSLFLGAFKYVHGGINKVFGLGTEGGITKALTTPASIAGKTINISKTFLKGLGGVGTEFAAMTAVDIPLSLIFDGKMPDMSAKDLAQTMGFILGMRFYGAVKVLGVKRDMKGNVVGAELENNGVKVFADQAKVKAAIEIKKENTEKKKTDKKANDGTESQEQKTRNMVTRMKTRNAPNKTGTRFVEDAPGNKNESKKQNNKGDIETPSLHGEQIAKAETLVATYEHLNANITTTSKEINIVTKQIESMTRELARSDLKNIQAEKVKYESWLKIANELPKGVYKSMEVSHYVDGKARYQQVTYTPTEIQTKITKIDAEIKGYEEKQQALETLKQELQNKEATLNVYEGQEIDVKKQLNLLPGWKDIKADRRQIGGSDQFIALGMSPREKLAKFREIQTPLYFGKKSRFGFNTEQAESNSRFMDQFSKGSTPEQIIQIREKIHEVIKQYTEKTGKAFDLTDIQIQSIINTHVLPGELGKLTQAELKTKIQELATVIPDADMRRFLLESGFCGMRLKDIKRAIQDGSKWLKEEVIYKSKYDAIKEKRVEEVEKYKTDKIKYLEENYRKPVIDFLHEQDMGKLNRERGLLSKKILKEIISNKELKEKVSSLSHYKVGEKLVIDFFKILKDSQNPSIIALLDRYSLLYKTMTVDAIPLSLLEGGFRNIPISSGSVEERIKGIDNLLTENYSFLKKGSLPWQNRVMLGIDDYSKIEGISGSEYKLLKLRYPISRDIKLICLASNLSNVGLIEGSMSIAGIDIKVAKDYDEKIKNILDPSNWEYRKQIKDRVYEIRVSGKSYILKEQKTNMHKDTMSWGGGNGNSSMQEFEVANKLYNDFTHIDNTKSISISREKPISSVSFADGYQFSVFEVGEGLRSYSHEKLVEEILNNKPQFLEEYNAIDKKIENINFEEYVGIKACMMHQYLHILKNQKMTEAGYYSFDGGSTQGDYRLGKRDGKICLDFFGYDFEYSLPSKDVDIQGYKKMQSIFQEIRDGRYEFNKNNDLVLSNTGETIDGPVFGYKLKTLREKKIALEIIRMEGWLNNR